MPGMSPRIIHIPLSGGDRKAQAKGIRYAHGIHNSQYRESVLIQSAAEAKIREADRLECEAWNAIMWAGGPAMPSPGDPQAEPTIAKAINGGFHLLEASRLMGPDEEGKLPIVAASSRPRVMACLWNSPAPTMLLGRSPACHAREKRRCPARCQN